MRAENYGSIWQVDHCFPLLKTNLSNEKHLLRSTHRIKFRPVRSCENNSKRSRINHSPFFLTEIEARIF